MKGLNKLALATAVAAAPFATQAMEPMSDQAMGETTGQAGVTIQLETNVGIDAIEYDQRSVDADGLVDGAETGSFLISDVAVGGIGNGADGDAVALDLGVDIDLIEDGGTTLQDGAVGKWADRELSQGDALIRLGSLDSDPVDLQVDVGEMGLRTDVGDGELGVDDGTALLFSDFQAQVLLSQLDISVMNDEAFTSTSDADGGANTGSIGIDTTFAVTSMDLDLDVAGVSLQNVSLAGTGSLEKLRAGSPLDPTTENQYATASLTVGAGEALVPNSATNGEVLRVSLDEFNADMYMPGVQVGSGSVGNVAMDNLSVTADMAVYGRE